MQNSTTELRISHRYYLGKQKSTLAGGLRYSYAWFNRKGGEKEQRRVILICQLPVRGGMI